MADKIFQTRIKLKKDTAANWESKNPVLLEGEQIFVVTAAGETRVKIGDGVKSYTQLPFTDEPIRTLIGTKADKTTTITAGDGLAGGGDLFDNRTISHADTSNVSDVVASERKYVTGLTFDDYGHVIGVTTGTETVTNTDSKVDVTLTNEGIAYLLGTYTDPTSTATGVTAVADTGVYIRSYIDSNTKEKNTRLTVSDLEIVSKDLKKRITSDDGMLTLVDNSKSDDSTQNYSSSLYGGQISVTCLDQERGNVWLDCKPGSVYLHDDNNAVDIGTDRIIIGDNRSDDARFTINADGSASATGIITANSFSGNGASLTSLNADNISSGTIAAARLPIATNSSIGGVKSGTDITVDSSGNVNVNNDSHTHSDSTITSLDASKLTGTIPSSVLPSYVDDVIEASNLDNFPLSGETGKIYVDLSTNLTYRWSGTQYVEISPSIALGETSSTAYRGDYGATAYTHATAKGSAFSSGLYKITTNDQGHVTAATAVTKSDITGLGIPGEETSVSFSQTSTSGNEIGKITIGGIDYTLYSPLQSTLSMTSDTSTTDKLPILFMNNATPTSGNSYGLKYNTSVTVLPSTGVLYGAAWNDYAEYRRLEEGFLEAGKVVTETGNDSVIYTKGRLESAPCVISDTYGIVIGEEREGMAPVAVGGKVLAYPYENRNSYKVGDVLCSGPNGTVSRMTRDEIREYPDRILGYYVGTPKEKEFNGRAINGRIWIRIK